MNISQRLVREFNENGNELHIPAHAGGSRGLFGGEDHLAG